RVLRHDGQLAGDVAARERVETRPAERHVPRLRLEDARQQTDERRLTAAVRADHADDLAGGDREAHAVEHGSAPVVVTEPLRRDRRRHASACTRLRRRSQMKNGPPRRAVTTPTGSSAGASAVRATVSAATRNVAPPRNDAGTRS